MAGIERIELLLDQLDAKTINECVSMKQDTSQGRSIVSQFESALETNESLREAVEAQCREDAHEPNVELQAQRTARLCRQAMELITLREHLAELQTIVRWEAVNSTWAQAWLANMPIDKKLRLKELLRASEAEPVMSPVAELTSLRAEADRLRERVRALEGVIQTMRENESPKGINGPLEKS